MFIYHQRVAPTWLIHLVPFLQNEIHKYRDKTIVLCGDFNARTGNLADQEAESDVSNILPGATHWSLSNATNTTARSNPDVKVNNYGKNLIELCKATGINIMNVDLQILESIPAMLHEGKVW